MNRVSIGIKVGYGVGDFAANLVFQSVMLYLMYFFTDVFMIGASAAGSIFLMSKNLGCRQRSDHGVPL